MLIIGICDDIKQEQIIISNALEKILTDYKEDIKIITYSSGKALLLDIEELEYEFSLLFLDILMNDMNGIETAHKLRNLGVKAPIIFLTTSPDFAIESYDVEAKGYLVKPLQEDKLKKILERVLINQEKPRVCVLSNRKYRYLYLDEITFAESNNHNIRIHLENGEVITSSEKLGDFATKLDNRFLRCHQSFLVNMQYIADVNENFILKNGQLIPIRTRERKAMADTYYKFFIKYTLCEKNI